MLDTKPLQQAIALAFSSTKKHGGLNRVLAAAVMSPKFCHLLLENPSLAVQTGFQGEAFSLTTEETALMLSIRANSLTELAQQLACAFGEQTQPATAQIHAPSLEFYGR